MSTFFELSKQLRDECGVVGTETTVVNATGEWNRLVVWTREAWSEIQQLHEQEWLWMRKSFSFSTTLNVGEYSPADAGITDLAEWRLNTLRTYLTAQGLGDEQRLSVMQYDEFRNLYLFNQTRVTYTRPIQVARAPNNNLLIAPAPNDVYTVLGDYQSSVQTLAADADVPYMPARFHRLIVYKAMMDYGAFYAAPEVYNRGQQKYKSMVSKLRLDQFPMIQRGNCII